MTHIKRDGRYLCRAENQPGINKYNWIKWTDAVKLTKMNRVCPHCQEVFYQRLNRTLTVV